MTEWDFDHCVDCKRFRLRRGRGLDNWCCSLNKETAQERQDFGMIWATAYLQGSGYKIKIPVVEITYVGKRKRKRRLVGMTTTTCINGELRAGDTVVSVDDSYEYLVGTVLRINLVGSPEHNDETANETDDVHVEFNGANYSEQRIREIEAEFTELYGEEKTFEDCSLDDVIMSPDMLIKADVFTKDEMNAILESSEKADSICKRVIAQFAKAEN
jgi:hypothetical protein